MAAIHIDEVGEDITNSSDVVNLATPNCLHDIEILETTESLFNDHSMLVEDVVVAEPVARTVPDLPCLVSHVIELEVLFLNFPRIL